MKWQDYLFTPTSILFKNTPEVEDDIWLSKVDQLGLIRYPNLSNNSLAEQTCLLSPESLLGSFFCPNRNISWQILQVAGLLIKSGKLDIGKCLFSAKYYGGLVYFKWFLFELGELNETNPIPNAKFPLDSSRWNKKRQHEVKSCV